MTRGRDRILTFIALFKFCKSFLLLVIALEALRLLRPGAAIRAQEWLAALALSSDRRVVQHLLLRLEGLISQRLEVLGIVALLYAALFAIEGVGLWRERRWAEYLTVIATASFIPFEIFQLARHATPPRAAALGLNLLVVTYLIYRLRHPYGEGRAAPPVIG
jgi:uncharacterized membrane protein (DUF2068 family)